MRGNSTTPQRIARVEVHVETIRSDISELKRDLRTIDEKLDGLALTLAQQPLPPPPNVPSSSIPPDDKRKYKMWGLILGTAIFVIYTAFSTGVMPALNLGN